MCKNIIAKSGAKVGQKGYRLVTYKKSIAYLYPEVIDFWSKENSVSCAEIAPGCTFPFVWEKDGKEFAKAPVKVFGNEKINLECEKPSKKTRDSLPQNLAYQCLLKYLPKTEYNKPFKEFTADICNEELKVVVEYDGLHFHTPREEKDNRRNSYYLGLGYKVFNIRPKGLKDLEEKEGLYIITVEDESNSETKRAVNEILRMLNVEGPYCFEGIIATRLYNSGKPFLETDAWMAKILDNEANKGINYNSISRGSGEYLSFKTVEASPITGELYELKWKARLEHQVKHPGCNPFNTNHRVLKGYNDFATFVRVKGDPDFLEYDYDYERNPDPSTIPYKSGVYIYAKCHRCGKDLSGPVASNRTKGDKWHGCTCEATSRCKKVVEIDSNRVFESALSAGKAFGLSHTTVLKHCKRHLEGRPAKFAYSN